MHPNYRLDTSKFISSLNLHYYQLQHTCGATIIHLKADDPENCYCISLPTRPKDSKGTPHILEHTVLCGSESYPVRDPFFSMDRRSLNTYLNASTYPDKTTYQGASQSKKDFFNLLEVYIDSVFHPLLSKESFLQEGHRLEFEKADQPSSPLCYKGIVYNEMKGALSRPEERLWYKTMQALYPNLPQGFNFGGDPQEILKLSHEELITFHKEFYHPSHAIFYFYGSIATEDILSFLDEKILSKTAHKPPLAPLPNLKPLKTPIQKKEWYPAQNESEEPHYATITWHTHAIGSTYDTYALCLVDQILMGTDASPLKRALFESGLCEQVYSFIEREYREVAYIIQLQSNEAIDIQAVEDLIQSTLKSYIKNPIYRESIESALHQLALQHMEITRGDMPYGLELCSYVLPLAQCGEDPTKGLSIRSTLKQLKEQSLTTSFLRDKIDSWLLSNPLRVSMAFSPSSAVFTKEHQQEHDALLATQAQLSEEEKREIVEQSKNLKLYQEAPEDLSCLPKLHRQEIAEKAQEIPLNSSAHHSFQLHTHETFTNNFVYWDFLFPLAAISQEDWPWLSLYMQVLTEIGCGGRSFEENLNLLQNHLGHYSCTISTYRNAFTNQQQAYLHISANAFTENESFLLNWCSDLLKTPNFDDADRIKELIHQLSNELESELVGNAPYYAKLDAAKSIAEDAFFEEKLSGLSFFQWMRATLPSIEKMPQLACEKLQQIHQQVFYKATPEFISSRPKEHKLSSSDISRLTTISQACPISSLSPFPFNEKSTQKAHWGHCISSSVAYTQLCVPTINYSHPLSAYQLVAQNVLRNQTLHRVIREQGGAYGTGARGHLQWGCFFFSTFSDPYLWRSVDAFKQSMEDAIHNLREEDIDEAILNAIAAIDAPVAPGSKALRAFGFLKEGKTQAIRDERKKQILRAEKSTLIAYIEEILKPNFKQGVLSSFASRSFFEQAGNPSEYSFQLDDI